MRPSPRDRLLFLLKTEGPQATSALSDALGLTGEAARQQLAKLADEGLVESITQPAIGRGRPRQSWRLTSAGHREFPDGHADVAVSLIDAIGSELGEDALDTIMVARERKTEAIYRAALADAETLEERVARLSALRVTEGYMASWWQEADGHFILVENHCPICAAATACRGFCQSEIDIFRSVLAAPIERTEHLLQGARRCAYRIG